MPSVHCKLCLKVFADFVLLIAVALPILLFYLIGDPYRRGFFCDDDSIRYPFKPSTVTSGALYAFGTIIPIISIIVVEFFHVKRGNVTSVRNEKFRKWFWAVYQYVGIFLFGCAISHLTVDICKYSIGRLRPHFVDVCKPNWDEINCGGDDTYIDIDVCNPVTKEDFKLLREARLSFISGHASFSTFTMFYLIFYLQYRFCFHTIYLLRPFLQYLCLGLAVFTSLSRISDYKHHWSDVLAGFTNGLFFAAFCAFWIARFRSPKNVFKNSDEISMYGMNTNEERQQDQLLSTF